MSILSDKTSNTTTNWTITLNRVERLQVFANSSEPALTADAISIPKYENLNITSITGTGTTRTLTFNHQLFELFIPDLVINNSTHSGLFITDISNTNSPTLPSNEWTITLNRAIAAGLPPETRLAPTDIVIRDTSVSMIRGNSTTREIVLTTAISSLAATDIVINNHDAPEMKVVTVVPNISPSFLLSVSPLLIADNVLAESLENIRQYLEIGLTQEELPNKTILDSYLSAAESEIYELLSLTSTEYDSRALSDSDFALKTRIATQYRTAALLVPALPSIVRQSSLRLSTEYNVLEPEKKIQFFLNRSKDEVEEFVPTSQLAKGYAAGSFSRRSLRF